MKKIIQIFIFIIIIIVSIFVYKSYLEIDSKSNFERETSTLSNNNTIKNFKYEVSLGTQGKYIINSEQSYFNNIRNEIDGNINEIINMQIVNAVYIDKNNTQITITANEAIYNSATYETEFKNNVKINYLNHQILSDKLILNFTENIMTITENVKYDSPLISSKSDFVKLNLLTKEIDVFMKNKNDKVKVLTK
jgi:lipopolysaccharide export system protein LptA